MMKVAAKWNDWSQCLEALAAVVMAVATVVTVAVAIHALSFGKDQLRQAEEHKQWQNYNELNARYSGLLQEIASPKADEKLDTNQKRQLWARRYFDLTSEEYWLHQRKLLPPDTWDSRIAPGIARNFCEIEFLPAAYEKWKQDASHIHPVDFVHVIDAIRRELPPCAEHQGKRQ